jgi:Spy/CpxP family protein refolding chaperone
MNKMIISLMLGLGLSWTAVAETGHPAAADTPASSSAAPQPEAGKHHGIKLKELSHELGLSEKQESKIKSLFKKHKQQINEIREERKDEIKEALTPEQKLKLSQMKEQGRDKVKALKQAVKEEEIKPEHSSRLE